MAELQPFRWFAWHPVWTSDRGWRWLRTVYRWRHIPPAALPDGYAHWQHSIERPGHTKSVRAVDDTRYSFDHTIRRWRES